MAGRQGNPLVLRKFFPNPDLVMASTGADIGFYIVSLVGQVIINRLRLIKKCDCLYDVILIIFLFPVPLFRV